MILGRKAAQKRRKKALKAQQQVTQEYLASIYGPGNQGRDDGTNAQSSPASERTGDEVSRVGRGKVMLVLLLVGTANPAMRRGIQIQS